MNTFTEENEQIRVLFFKKKSATGHSSCLVLGRWRKMYMTGQCQLDSVYIVDKAHWQELCNISHCSPISIYGCPHRQMGALFTSCKKHMHNLCLVWPCLLLGSVCWLTLVCDNQDLYTWMCDLNPIFIQVLVPHYICKTNAHWLFLTKQISTHAERMDMHKRECNERHCSSHFC